jgi:hypothetical protein
MAITYNTLSGVTVATGTIDQLLDVMVISGLSLDQYATKLMGTGSTGSMYLTFQK